MNVRTKEEFIDAVSQDHAWRVREIAELRRLVSGGNSSTLSKDVLCRSGVALVYAHWEGFVKKAGSYFLKHVAERRCTIRDLKSNFVTLKVKARIEEASKSSKSSAFEEITEYILDNQDARLRLPYKGVIDTGSNLSSSVLKEIAWCIGIDYNVFSTKEKFIDQSLVARRNHIAHGGPDDVSPQEFEDVANEVIILMNLFRNEIENSAVAESYKKSSRAGIG